MRKKGKGKKGKRAKREKREKREKGKKGNWEKGKREKSFDYACIFKRCSKDNTPDPERQQLNQKKKNKEENKMNM